MLPWAEMWRAALHAGVSPQAFWQLSVREWRWLAGPYGAGLDRSGLRSLMQAFPDRDAAQYKADGGKNG